MLLKRTTFALDLYNINWKGMKKFIVTLVCAIFFAVPSFSQNLNDNADNIVGEYLTDRGGSKSKVRVTKMSDGTYMAQMFWVENPFDKNGNRRKDVKNPDKSLRNIDIDKVVIVKGLKYDAEDKEWNGAKIYDPSKGIRVNVEAEFVEPNKLKLFGNIWGIGTTIYWQKLK